MTRRDLLNLAGTSLIATRPAQPATADGEDGCRKEFKHAYLAALSPDGRKLCLGFGKNLAISYRATPDRIERIGKRGGLELKVVEFGSWRELFSIAIPFPSDASFSNDSKMMVVNRLSIDPQGDGCLVLDLATGQIFNKVVPPPNVLRTFYGYSDEILIATDSARNPEVGIESLMHVKLEDMSTLRQELWRPIAIESVTRACFSPLVMSLDRTRLVHCVGEHVLCRRSSDLGVLWTRTLDADFDIWRIAVASNGSYVAVASNEARLVADMLRYRVDILDARDGSTFASLQINGIEGIAVSNTGRLLAVGEQRRLRGRIERYELRVRVFDVTTGRQVADYYHDRIRKERGIINEGFIIGGIQFTPDDQRIIGSGRHTKVWDAPKL